MKEIHFFERKNDAVSWYYKHDDLRPRIWIAEDYRAMEWISHLVNGNDYIVTTQMSFLSTEWFEKGFRIFVHDRTGMFEIVLGEGNERTDREIMLGNNLFNLWRGGEFGLREE